MRQMLDVLFTDEEMVRPRVGVGAGLLAYLIVFFQPVMGLGTMVIGIPLMILALGLVCFAIMRWVLPMLDPRNPDSDVWASWGGVALFVAAGIASFGIWFPFGLIVGAVLIWLRVPELLEVFPWLDDETPGPDR